MQQCHVKYILYTNFYIDLFNFSASFSIQGENKTVYFTRILNISKECFGLFLYDNNKLKQIIDDFEINLQGDSKSFIRK